MSHSPRQRAPSLPPNFSESLTERTRDHGPRHAVAATTRHHGSPEGGEGSEVAPLGLEATGHDGDSWGAVRGASGKDRCHSVVTV